MDPMNIILVIVLIVVFASIPTIKKMVKKSSSDEPTNACGGCKVECSSRKPDETSDK